METNTKPSLIEDIPTPPSDGFLENAGSHEEDASFEYKILKEGLESTGEWVSGDKLRMDYLRTTDGLIHKITKGMEITDKATGEKVNQPYSTIIFLDKSARPVSHLVREMWPVSAKDLDSGEIPPMPEFKFLNIDRRQWINEIDPVGTGIINMDSVDESVIRSLRSISLTPEGKRQVEADGLTEEIENMPAALDNKTILVVDETHYSGDTLRIATGLLGRAFPTAQISTAYWMKEKVKGHNRNPRWYDDTTKMGRGVNDRYADVKKLANSPEKNLYQKIGGYFLSAPHWRVEEGLRDELYYQLIGDIKELVHNPDVPVMPSFGREDAEDRIVAYNSGFSDISHLSSAQKDKIVDNVIERKNAIEKDSAEKSLPR